MATAARADRKSIVKESTFLWEGKNGDGKMVRGEMRPPRAVVQTTLRRQGILVGKVSKQRFKRWQARSPRRTSRCSPASWRP